MWPRAGTGNRFLLLLISTAARRRLCARACVFAVRLSLGDPGFRPAPCNGSLYSVRIACKLHMAQLLGHLRDMLPKLLEISLMNRGSSGRGAMVVTVDI